MLIIPKVLPANYVSRAKSNNSSVYSPDLPVLQLSQHVVLDMGYIALSTKEKNHHENSKFALV